MYHTKQKEEILDIHKFNQIYDIFIIICNLLIKKTKKIFINT